MATGTIVSVDQAKSMLREANRDYYGRKTWQSLYGNIALQEQQAMSSLTQDYASDVAEAYASAYQNRQAVAASNIGQGYKAVAQENIDAALAEAFETYQANYLSGASQIAQSSAKQIGAVSELEQTQAENVAALSGKPYEYLQSIWAQYKDSYNKDLWDEYSALDDKYKAAFLEQHPEMQASLDNLFNNPNWQKYLTQRTDADTGEAYYDLMTWDELAQTRGFYDENKSLTAIGTDFFDQMINEAANLNIPGVQSFGEWLRGSNAELYDWATSEDAFNYSLRGNNMGTFQQYIGMMSTDQQYQFVERYGGMSSEEVKGLFGNIETKANDIAKRITEKGGTDTKAIANDYKGLISEVATVTKQLGYDMNALEEEFATELKAAGLVSNDTTRVSFEQLGDILFNEASQVKNVQKEQTQIVTAGTGVGMAGGAFVGGLMGSVVPGAGTVAGAAIGAFVGGLSGTIAGLVDAMRIGKDLEKENMQISKNIQRRMETLITTLTAYAEQQRRLKQEGY